MPQELPPVLPASQKQKSWLGSNVDFFFPVARCLASATQRNSATKRDPFASSTTEASGSKPVDPQSLAIRLSHHFNVKSREDSQSQLYMAVPANSFINFKFTGARDTNASEIPKRKKRCKQSSGSEHTSSSERPAVGTTVREHLSNIERPKTLVRELEIITVPAAYDEESFELYKRYQVKTIFMDWSF